LVAAAADALRNKVNEKVSVFFMFNSFLTFQDSEDAQKRLEELMAQAKRQAEELAAQQKREAERRQQLLKVRKRGNTTGGKKRFISSISFLLGICIGWSCD
jgi:uncharacterized protein YdaU (DUF1376 family)